MRKITWDRVARVAAVALVVLSLALPLYRLEALGETGVTSVFAREAVGADAALAVVFAAPLLIAFALGRLPRSRLGAVVMAAVPLAPAYSIMVVYVVSGTAAIGVRFWKPMQSALGAGSWALILADLLLLGAWGRIAWRGLRGQPRVAI